MSTSVKADAFQFSGLEHSGVCLQCQGGKTSAMILKGHNVISKQITFIILSKTNIHMWKTLNTVSNLPANALNKPQDVWNNVL